MIVEEAAADAPATEHMRDGALRRAVKAVALAHFRSNRVVDRGLRRLRAERSYRLAGACRACGQCCERPSIYASRWLRYLPLVRRTFLWWQRVVNGLELVPADRFTRVLTFRCRHFDPTTRRCDSYDSRPGMCRDYPRVLLTQPNPELFAGCGHQVIAPNAERLRRELERRGLTPEQMERLRRDLHLGP
jgi:uncharacterized protein